MFEKFHRGDIYSADLSPGIGSEQSGSRPVLILQNNVGNRSEERRVGKECRSRWSPYH